MAAPIVPAEKPIIPGGFAAGDTPSPYSEDVPENLRRATSRLQFPPSYVVVGFYRLITDRNLRVPAWNKCKHGFVRGASVGLIWVSIVSPREVGGICSLIQRRLRGHTRSKRHLLSTSSSSKCLGLHTTAQALKVSRVLAL